jgi:hypothetical protein
MLQSLCHFAECLGGIANNQFFIRHCQVAVGSIRTLDLTVTSRVLYRGADTHIMSLIRKRTCKNSMEQRTFKNVNNCLNTNINFYLETSGGRS